MSEIYAVILAGGSGTRFWPASRRTLPKQLLAIAPGSEETLIAATVRRALALTSPEHTIIATGAHLVEATRRALPSLPESAFLGEPVARNTAAPIAWATSLIAERDPDALVFVLPSDHYVRDVPAFERTARAALASAATGPITTVGITPTRPETGYGYIQLGRELGPNLHQVGRFVEKPDRARAEAYVASGDYVWNSGMFFFRASVMLDAVARHLPELASGLAEVERSRFGGAGSDGFQRAFAALPSVSIDHGVMEKEAPLHVVRGELGWNDLGSWQTAWELADKDADGNAADPEAVLVDSRDNLVRLLTKGAAPRVVALAGVHDLCVVCTDDAILIVPRERAQDARLIVDALTAAGKADLV